MKQLSKERPTYPVPDRIQIAVVGRWHFLDPAWSLNDAGRVGSYEPKRLVSPSQERPKCDLIIHEIPYICTTR